MPASPSSLLETALSYLDAGLEVIPNHPKHKFPKGIQEWQTRTFTKEDLTHYIGEQDYVIGVRNVEGLDFDNHGTPSAQEMITAWAQILKESYPDLLNKLLVESTPSGGFHVVWRCEIIEGNTKLASRPAMPGEEQGFTMIETRGLGGQFMVSPSPGYTLLRGDWTNLPVIDEGERLAILMAAIVLDMTPSNYIKTSPTQKKTDNSNSDGENKQRPGDLYNDDPALSSQTLPLLLEHGWQVVFEREGTYFLRRPGKTQGISATLGHVAPDVFYNFSSNGAPFEVDTAYSPFAVYAMLAHDGDYQTAAATLSRGWEEEGPFVNPAFVEEIRNREPKKKSLTKEQLADFAVIGGDELLDTVLPTENWLINRIIPATGFCVFAAAEGSWKTFLTLSLAQSLASGDSWLNHPQFTVEKPGSILFIDKENPMTIIQQRIKGLGYTREMAKRVNWVKYPEKLQLTKHDKDGVRLSDFMEYLSTVVKEKDIDLIVVDSLVDLLAGNENSSGDTQVFFDALRVAFPDKSILLLHHENKPSQGVYRSDAQRTRGSTNINAQAAVMFRIEPVSGTQTELTLKQTKARFTQKLDKFLVQVDVETVDAEKQVTVVRGFKYSGEIEDTKVNEKGEQCLEIIKELLGEEIALTRTKIIEHCVEAEISKPTVERVLKTAFEEEVLGKRVKGREVEYYLSARMKMNQMTF